MEQTVKCFSPSTKEECKPAHYLAELSITRKATKYGKSLPYKFWNSIEWKREYKLAIMAAHSLLKLFDFKSILSALNSDDGKWIFSLKCESLLPLIMREAEKNKREQKLIESKTPINVKSENVKNVPKPITKKNKADILRD